MFLGVGGGGGGDGGAYRRYGYVAGYVLVTFVRFIHTGILNVKTPNNH